MSSALLPTRSSAEHLAAQALCRQLRRRVWFIAARHGRDPQLSTLQRTRCAVARVLSLCVAAPSRRRLARSRVGVCESALIYKLIRRLEAGTPTRNVASVLSRMTRVHTYWSTWVRLKASWSMNW
eukprot:Amastigsp_a510176_81.p2 type:complete len:125 gc:universal Amastigsp_a510176_81:203-577(+)